MRGEGEDVHAQRPRDTSKLWMESFQLYSGKPYWLAIRGVHAEVLGYLAETVRSPAHAEKISDDLGLDIKLVQPALTRLHQASLLNLCVERPRNRLGTLVNQYVPNDRGRKAWRYYQQGITQWP